MKGKAICIRCILAGLFCGRWANATVIMTPEQVGPNLVATGSETVNLNSLSLGSSDVAPQIAASFALVLVGDRINHDVYNGISGRTNFGSGSGSLPSTSTGNPLGIFGRFGELIVPQGYVSGTPLFAMATWNNRTLAALGVTPGVYTWT